MSEVFSKQTVQDGVSISMLEKNDGSLLADVSCDDWAELPTPLVIDSGAAESVLPVDWCQNYAIKESAGQRAGVTYTAADGNALYNKGEKTLLLSSLDGSDWRKMTFQCTDVNKALGSVSQIVRNGSKVVFDSEGSYILDKPSGAKLWLEERNGVFVLPAYVAPNRINAQISSDFGRQGW